MKVGLYVLNQAFEGEDAATVLDQAVEQVRTARDAGFASIWCGEHFLVAPVQFIQPYPLLARLVPETGAMTIGPNLVILPLRPPALVAEEAATLDLLSGGRSVLCVGLGYREEEFRAFGVPLAERVSRFTENLSVIRRLFTERTVTHHGPHYSIDGVGLGLRPLQRPHPPIWVAATVDSAVRRAARLGDAWMTLFTQSFEQLRGQMAIYRAALDAAGKPFPSERPLLRECYIGTDNRTAAEECRGSLGAKYEFYRKWGLGGLTEDLTYEDLVRDWFFVGDVEAVRDKILRYRDELGFNHVIVRAQWPGLSHAQATATIRRLGRIAADLR
jgi:alkanesulfonate monooxygenase SsuD/methylene tetrahydromethanopterin reductase-like flavin-dependent oxidoreductase (luciferase family)